jgi:hypothetical protein
MMNIQAITTLREVLFLLEEEKERLRVARQACLQLWATGCQITVLKYDSQLAYWPLHSC